MDVAALQRELQMHMGSEYPVGSMPRTLWDSKNIQIRDLESVGVISRGAAFRELGMSSVPLEFCMRITVAVQPPPSSCPCEC